ncbi:hypothetical protein F2P81_014087 [Scophthalmus maximus]|uniref:Uncharacterized protein n=1 Tax=Scophthalmus maximus TaxID=52904 RepID=A0A6A4SSN4_SCOMX|nr:hypothetical protein F2P81_014087 [Scophthalmus maximus]
MTNVAHHFTRCSHTPDGARILLLRCTAEMSADKSRRKRRAHQRACNRTSDAVALQLLLLLLLLRRTTLPHRESGATEADEGDSRFARKAVR